MLAPGLVLAVDLSVVPHPSISPASTGASRPGRTAGRRPAADRSPLRSGGTPRRRRRSSRSCCCSRRSSWRASACTGSLRPRTRSAATSPDCCTRSTPSSTTASTRDSGTSCSGTPCCPGHSGVPAARPGRMATRVAVRAARDARRRGEPPHARAPRAARTLLRRRGARPSPPAGDDRRGRARPRPDGARVALLAAAPRGVEDLWRHVTPAQLALYQTVSDHTWGILANVAGLYGYWNDADPIKAHLATWPLLALALAALAGLGLAARRRDTTAWAVARRRSRFRARPRRPRPADRWALHEPARARRSDALVPRTAEGRCAARVRLRVSRRARGRGAPATQATGPQPVGGRPGWRR